VTFDDWARQGLPGMLRFATALCGGRHLAEEVVQDAVIKAHRNWDRVQRAGNPDAYLRKIVVNEFLSWRRKWSRFVPRPDIRDPAPVDDHADRHADRDELIDELAKLSSNWATASRMLHAKAPKGATSR
jgi:DNA-directed RNA polymerase specialized sigma24 family protein